MNSYEVSCKIVVGNVSGRANAVPCAFLLPARLLQLLHFVHHPGVALGGQVLLVLVLREESLGPRVGADRARPLAAAAAHAGLPEPPHVFVGGQVLGELSRAVGPENGFPERRAPIQILASLLKRCTRAVLYNSCMSQFKKKS